MTTRQKPCPDCGGGVVWAHAPNGGRVRLEPYPTLEAGYRVDVLASGLMILRPGERSSTRTKTYERHQCVTAAKATPRERPEQLQMFADGAG